jgi:RNase P/RNase MRP subunit p30
MTRIYVDLHTCTNFRDNQKVSRMMSKASKLGYRLIGFTFPANSSNEEIEKVRSICAEAKIDMVSRVDLKPRKPKELIYDLRRLRRRFEIICVYCESKDVARQAAKDRRVDLLNSSAIDLRRRSFDRAEAELASNSLASLEVDMKSILTLEGVARIRLLSALRRETATAQEFRVPIVVSSGASEEMLMRKPRELAALTSLFGLDEVTSVEAVSANPLKIVRRNREKLDPKFVAPGIRVIREGKDC